MRLPARVVTSSDSVALSQAYAVALHGYVTYPDEGGLSEAYDLGRSALGDGMSPLALVLLHDAALEHISRLLSPGDHLARTRAAAFLVEALSPFELIHQRFLEDNVTTRGVNEALEHESRRTARQIHDGAGQLLFSLQLALAEIKANLPEDSMLVENALGLADHLDQQLRGLSRDLYPVTLDELGINAAIQHLLHGVETRTRLRISFRSSVPDRLAPALASCLYRVVQEAVTNVVRHAHATAVDVDLERKGQRIICSVRDDGVGLPERDARKAGLGLLGIRERVKSLCGDINLTSSRGGTHLIISVPAGFMEESDGYQNPGC